MVFCRADGFDAARVKPRYQTVDYWFTPVGASNSVQEGEMAGYLLVPNQRVPKPYNAGFSMYVAAWPLLDEYPGHL